MVQKFCTSSGPTARAGFIAAPVYGPPMQMSSVIVKPIARPAIVANAPRGSAAVAKITQTRKKVSTASIATPPNPLMPGASEGAPRLTASTCCCGSTAESRKAARIAPTNCANQ